MSVTRPTGFRAAGLPAGIRPSGKPDLALIVCDQDDPTKRSSAAVFTTNRVVGAPIQIGLRWRREAMAGEAPPLRAVLVNSGNANAATGAGGIEDAERCAERVAGALGIGSAEVLPSSTGVIGRRLPLDRILDAIPRLADSLARGPEADEAAATAIMTTDLTRKSAHREVELFGHQVHIGAIGKGSGMIAPRFDTAGAAVAAPMHATMLGFVTTDAPIQARAFQAALEAACADSFDRISVDAHPSCSDSCVALSSGMAPIPMLTADLPEYHGFRAALAGVCRDLAEQIVGDGEGATRIFRVDVRGAASVEDARRIAREVVDSPLVKCAIHGRDPNWGRIVTAAGNAGVPFDPHALSLRIGGTLVYESGMPTGVPPKDPSLKGAMEADPVELVLGVGEGPGAAWMLGCDLSAEYVRINADYTT